MPNNGRLPLHWTFNIHSFNQSHRKEMVTCLSVKTQNGEDTALSAEPVVQGHAAICRAVLQLKAYSWHIMSSPVECARWAKAACWAECVCVFVCGNVCVCACSCGGVCIVCVCELAYIHVWVWVLKNGRDSVRKRWNRMRDSVRWSGRIQLFLLLWYYIHKYVVNLKNP